MMRPFESGDAKTGKTMNNRWMLGVLLLTIGAAGCGGDVEAGDTGEANETEGFTRVINVEVAELGSSDFQENIRLTGTVEAHRDVMVGAEEGGTVVQVFREKGVRVQAGQAIAKIDDRILTAQVQQARAQAALARETWQRRQRLYEQDQVGSELAYLEAKYMAEQAEASLAALEQRLANTVIRAPISGILDDRMVEVGTMVSPGAATARVIDLDPVKITAGVPERYALDVRPGAAASVTFDVLPGEEFTGTISYVGAAVDPRSRTFAVELTLLNENGMIKPEMAANVSVVRGVVTEAVVVPQEALIRVEDGYVAYVVESDGGQDVARTRRVEPGPSQRNQVVIREGLQPGDKLIVVGQQQVEDGDRVRVVGTNRAEG